MLVALEMPYLLKLRIILLSNFLYLFLTIIIILYALLFNYFNQYHSKYQGTEKNIAGYITDIKVDGNKFSFYIKAKDKIIATYYAKSKESLSYLKTNYHLGDYLEFKGELTTVKANGVFNLFDYQKYLHQHKIFYIFEATNVHKIKDNHNLFFYLKQMLITRIDNLKYTSISVKAFVLGDSFLIDTNVMQTYQTNGISHLLALSGANVVLLAAIILFCLKKCNVKETKRYIIVILILFLYTFFANFSASIVRATFFFTLLTINKIFYFHIKTLNILQLTFFILLIYNPYYLFELGFQFSFVISFYLILFQDYINHQNKIIVLYRVSLISFLGSLPITIYNFFQINLLAPLYNLFFVPLVSIIIYPLSLVTVIFSFLDYPLSIFINLMEKTSIICDKIIFSKIILAKPPFLIVIIYYILITLIIRYQKQKHYKQYIILLIVLIIHSNIAIINRYPTLTMIDVGQGDSFLIQLPHNKTNIIIDTGGKMPYELEPYQIKNKTYSTAINTIIPYLKSIGIKKIDYLILTHGDYDHMGEALNLIDNFKVKNIILNAFNLTNIEQELVNNKTNISFYQCDNQLNFSNVHFYFLNPCNDLNENDNSLVMYVKIYNYKILMMGDASQTIEQNLISKYDLSNIDILKIGHHGSNTSSSEKFLNVTNPKYALISVGLNNNFGHPSQKTLNQLETKNIKIFLTSKQGSLKITFKKDKLLFNQNN